MINLDFLESVKVLYVYAILQIAGHTLYMYKHARIILLLSLSFCLFVFLYGCVDSTSTSY